MTGLDYANDRIIEIAVIVTNAQLEIIAKGPPNLVIHQPENIMSAMNSWCIEHHGKTGLTAAVKKSTLTTRQAEVEVLEFLKKFISKPKTAPLAGNSVHADRAFLVVSLKEVFTTDLPQLIYSFRGKCLN